MARQLHVVGLRPDRWVELVTGQVVRRPPGVRGQVQGHLLGVGREVVEAQHRLVRVVAQEGEDRGVGPAQVGEAAGAEDRVGPPDHQHRPHPLEQRTGVHQLRLDVDQRPVVLGVDDQREVELGLAGGGEAGPRRVAPLHRRPDAVAVVQPDVVAHADLVAVVEARGPGQREQQGVQQPDPGVVAVDQGGEPAADTDVAAHPWVGRVLRPHVLAVLVGDHLQGELVVVAQEGTPLAALGDGRGVGEDVGDAGPVGLPQAHVEPGHHREMEGHLALVPVAEVLDHVMGPLVRLAEQQRAGVVVVELLADRLEQVMGAGQVLAVRPVGLDQVGHRVESETVDAQVGPEPQRRQHLVQHPGIVEVEVGLVAVEAVPEVLPAHLVVAPVGLLGVDEDDPGVEVRVGLVAPHVVVAVRAVRVAPGLLEPRMTVRGVVHHEVDDDPDAPLVGLRHEAAEIRQGAELGHDVAVVRDVVPAVGQRGGEERRQPQAVDPQPLEVVEAVREPRQIADPVTVGIGEIADHHLVEHGSAEPLRVGRRRHRARSVPVRFGRDHRQYVGGLLGGEPDEVVGPPVVLLAGQLVADPQLVALAEPEDPHVEVDGRLLGVLGVEVHRDDDGVLPVRRRGLLDVRDHLRVLRVLEADVA
ncbi:hypothetical protein SDC9_86032 [bioreactor metagenome]|uniref:Uncharacterized protein n=1 Tax=bioreactor metagenome TaxID=1076179 RepID=A0A644ZF42_9ZZZZ